MKHLAMVLLLGAALAGCASVRPDMSYVAPGTTATDAQVLGASAARYLSGPLPPAQTTLIVAPPPAQGDGLTAVMLEQLRKTGYGIVQVEQNRKETVPANAVALRYLVSPLDGGVLLRLQYQGKVAARFYPRAANGALSEGAPFMVRENGQ